jgi:N-acetyl-gamma-glutamyl-phosphate reductase
VIDTSTAHRTDPAWAYGFPELSKKAPREPENRPAHRRAGVPRQRLHRAGLPLIEAGALPKDALLTCHSLTGYSGGGKA